MAASVILFLSSLKTRKLIGLQIGSCKAVDESCLEAPAQATCKSNKSTSCSTTPHSMFKVSNVQRMLLLALLGIDIKCNSSHFLQSFCRKRVAPEESAIFLEPNEFGDSVLGLNCPCSSMALERLRAPASGEIHKKGKIHQKRTQKYNEESAGVGVYELNMNQSFCCSRIISMHFIDIYIYICDMCIKEAGAPCCKASSIHHFRETLVLLWLQVVHILNLVVGEPKLPVRWWTSTVAASFQGPL